MTDSTGVRCCGRLMTKIGVEQAREALELHSCPSCGRHAWRRAGRPVDREQLLAALRVQRPAAPAAPGRAPARGRQHEDDRRSELQRLLTQFTVHGSAP